MFKLDMQAIRENAKDALLIANVANAANSANGCVAQLATLAGLAISNDADTLIEPPLDRAQWLEIDREYQRHHWSCPTCQAAGRGSQYGLRCGVGAALWNTYSNTVKSSN